MALFQNSVLASYKQDEALIASRWAAYQNFLAKTKAIETFKEEEYQEGFLKDVFESCLGYTLKTSDPANFTLERETKNETDSKKADGAIYVEGKVTGVIELKAQNTQNLDKATDQAFGYLTKNSHATYVIVSNFDELRFYVEKATDYEKFHLFSLDYDGFKKLHLILSFESIAKELPHAMKQKSQNFEHEISKQLYKDFSAFRTHLFENIVKNNFTCHAKTLNQVQGDDLGQGQGDDLGQVQDDVGDDAKSTPNLDKTQLLRLTQKLCDRIIFILFAEDRGLLNPNTIKEIRSRHADDIMGNPIYGYYKIYFNAINQGNEKLAIPKYNGGLFAPDALLESLVIDDEVLDMEAQKLSDYDFASDISVNILGHIFEQSLTDLEEMERGFANEASATRSRHSVLDTESKKTPPISKRKKDGVFYTPEYITRYIVQNTLGTLCDEKKEKLSLAGEAFASPINPKKLTKEQEKHKQNILDYRAWLENLKILDPACGSGAFLNQALEFLIAEHTQVRDKLLPFQDLTLNYEIETAILEHNLYGVDINEDAVEIARLSLWLRTARRGRTLTNLSEKIVCANSLLNMPFPEGSFDVVIGNPPYVRVQGLKSNYEEQSRLYEAKYQSATGNYDLYALFLEASFGMLKPTGKLSYILPHKFLISDFGSGLRGFLAQHKAVENLLHFGSEMVFEDASTYTCIVTLSHANEKLLFKSIKPQEIFEPFTYDAIDYEKLNSDKWNLANQDTARVLEKINRQPLRVKDVFAKIFQGIATSGDDVYLLLQTKEGLYSKALDQVVEVEQGLLKPMLKGEDINRYGHLQNRYGVIFPYLIEEGKAKPMSETYIQELFPKGYAYLKANESFLRGREKGRFDNPKEWFLFSRQQGLNGVEQEKIITPEIALNAQMSLDNGHFYHNTKGYSFIKKLEIQEEYKFYLTLLNSSLMWFFLKNTGYELRGGYFTFKTKFLEPFPLPKLNNLEQQEPFIEKADQMLSLNKQLQETKQNFLNELGLEKLPKKLQNFEELEFDEFVKEYAKAKKIKFADKLAERTFKQEWQAMFEQDKTMACSLKEQIAQTDKAIDAMVYKLYDLTDEEIKIVEGNH